MVIYHSVRSHPGENYRLDASPCVRAADLTSPSCLRVSLSAKETHQPLKQINLIVRASLQNAAAKPWTLAGLRQVFEMNVRAPDLTSLPNSRPQQSRGFGAQQTWDVVCRHAGLIVLTTLAVVLLATIYVLQVHPHYVATSEVLFDPRKSSVGNSTDVLSNLTADQPTILNQIEILTSHRFAGNVVDRLHLDADPEFVVSGLADSLFSPGIDRREIAIDNLRKRLKVAQAGFSSTIRITFESPDRQKATNIAAVIAALYVQEQIDTKSRASQQASRWLTQRVAELARQVKDAEAAVQKYKADHRITITAAGTSVVEQQVTDLSSQLTVAKTEYDDKAAKANRTAELLKSGQIASSPQSVASPLIVALRTQQSELNREIANLSTRYGPNHPKIVELVAQRANLESKISQETQRIADSVRNDAETSRTHVASLQSSLHQIEDLSARKNEDAVELVALQSVAASARSMYQAFLTQYSQTENQQGILRPDAYVISASEVEDTFGPQTKLLAILSSLPAGLFLGLALAFMAEAGRSSVGGEGRVRERPEAAPAMALPEMGAAARAADLIVTGPNSPFSHAVSRLLTTVVASTSRPATVVVTSAAPGSGKTTLSLALARAAAQAGLRTIVMDANGAYGHLDRMAGRSTHASLWPGQVPMQGGMESFIDCDPLSSALVMAANPAFCGYEQVVAGPLLTRLIDNLQRDFDFLVINAPMLSDGLAPQVLALADHVLVAVDARRPAVAVDGSLARWARPVTAVFTHAR